MPARGNAGLLLIAAACAVAACRRTAPHPTPGPRGRLRLDAEFAAAERCLIGPPLRKGEQAASRLRAVELGNLAAPWAALAQPPEQRWPARCGPYLDRLADAAAMQPGADELRAAARAAAQTTRGGEAGGDAPRLWDLAARAGVHPDDPPPGVSAPPPAARPLARETLQPLVRGAPALDVLASDPQPSRAVHLIVAPPSREPALHRVCTFEPDALAEVRCLPLGVGTPAGPDVAYDLLAADDQAPMLYAAVHPARGALLGRLGGESAFYPLAGGPRIASPGTVSGFTARDGSVTVLQYTARGYALRRGAPPSLGPPAPLPARPDVLRRATLAWDRVVWIEHAADGDVLRALPGSTAGPVPAPRLGMQACHSAAGTSVITSGEPDDAATFFDGTRWSTPVRAPGLVALESPPLCRADHVTRTRLRVDGGRVLAVTHVDCSPAGCTRAESRVDLGPLDYASGDAARAADLGGRVLLVWRVPAASGGGVWMRLGAPDALDRTPATVLLDDAAHGGLDATGLDVFSREGAALILVHTLGGSYPLRVLPDGTCAPVAVREGAS